MAIGTKLAPGARRAYLKPMIQNVVRAAALGLLKIYQTVLSPVFYFFGARCRHEPSCSEYAGTAFKRHRAGRAFWLTLSRLLRCHPLGSHGFDPVPGAAPRVGWRFWRLGDWSWRPRGEPPGEH